MQFMKGKQKWLALAAGCLLLGTGQAGAASADQEAAQMAAPAVASGATAQAPSTAAITSETSATEASAMSESAAEEPAASETTAPETSTTVAAESEAAASPETTETETGASSEEIPNPFVPYDSYAAMVSALSFHPLYFPLSSGLELTDRYIIGGTTAELHYTSRYGQDEKRARFVVRTALVTDDMNAETLSGVYGAQWQTQQLGATQVQLAELGSDSFVAYWTRGGYAFSVGADQLNRWDFVRQLRDNLIDLSEHYYD